MSTSDLSNTKKDDIKQESAIENALSQQLQMESPSDPHTDNRSSNYQFNDNAAQYNII